MNKLVIYIHGKNGLANEAEHYKNIFKNHDVIGFDYKSQNPWEANKEFPLFFDEVSKNYKSIIIIANSIGAFFTMNSLSNKKIEKAFFISPIVDMEKLISDLMLWSGVTENELQDKKEIQTQFGEKLSWEYLCYVRKNKVNWKIPTHILYGEKDNLTSKEIISNFANKINATLTIMKNGEHWFHTDEQINFLDKWLERLI